MVRLAGSRIAQHVLFWLGVLFVYSLVEMMYTRQGWVYTLSNNIIRMCILGLAVYYNLYRLLPRYLVRKRFWQYLSALSLVVFIVTPIEAFLIFIKSDGIPEMQANVLDNLNWYFLPNFFVIGTSTVVKITMDWYKNLRAQQELETQTMQSELRFLRSQINPHFLFNTLNNLYALTLKKSDKAPEIVLKLSEMMRYMLYECNERWVELSKEVAYIANYLALERLRQGGATDIRFEVRGESGQRKIAPLIFIPFLENCFKHGLGANLSGGFVHILLDIRDLDLLLEIENSKPRSMPKPLAARSGGIGLANVRRRLDLLYPGRYTLVLDDQPDRFAVRLTLRLEETGPPTASAGFGTGRAVTM
ncbi:MAG: hypothetical protein RLY31_1639 [Bacteroidota bacterium]|jgi:hypothetical protein